MIDWLSAIMLKAAAVQIVFETIKDFVLSLIELKFEIALFYCLQQWLYALVTTTDKGSRHMFGFKNNSG